jgi:hypothetical protein
MLRTQVMSVGRAEYKVVLDQLGSSKQSLFLFQQAA